MEDLQTQLSMGFDSVPDVSLLRVEQPPGLPLVPRPHPTWVLLANKKGPIGFHHLLYTAPYGLHVALCGAKGRRVSEDSPEIPLCPLCVAQRHEGPR
jgi:hypothetical protein